MESEIRINDKKYYSEDYVAERFDFLYMMCLKTIIDDFEALDSKILSESTREFYLENLQIRLKELDTIVDVAYNFFFLDEDAYTELLDWSFEALRRYKNTRFKF